MFPVEIWEEILKHADPVDLLTLKRVCKCWYAMIPKILEQSNIWYKKCLRDLPHGLWSTILEQQHHSAVNWKNFHEAKDEPDVWIALYRSWREWRNLVGKAYTVETHEPVADHRPLERINCVSVLNNVIAIGSSEGYINFLDITKSREFLSPMIDHTLPIQSVQMWRNGVDHIIVTFTSNHDRIYHYNLHDEVLESHSRGTLISASFQYCYMVMNNMLTVERPGSYAGKKCDLESSITLVMDRFHLPRFGKIVAMCGDREEVMLWTEENIHLLVYTYPEYSGYREFKIQQPNIPIRFYKPFKPRIIGCVGEQGEFGFSIDRKQWKIYNLFNKFYARVTAILFHVGVLVLGLETGEIHLFAINNIDALENLNFETMPSRKIILNTDAITSLNATEHESMYYIVAATDKKLHIVKFHSG